jgi:hypothetical protein
MIIRRYLHLYRTKIFGVDIIAPTQLEVAKAAFKVALIHNQEKALTKPNNS